MKTLIIVRNGEHSDKDEVARDRDKVGRLSAAGQAKVASLAERLKTIVDEQPVLILSSPAYRSSETAAILGKQLLCQVKEDWDLTGSLHEQEVRARLLRMISAEGNRVDVLIVVTQESSVTRLPPMFSPDPDKPFALQGLERGQERILDLTTGVSRLVN